MTVSINRDLVSRVRTTLAGGTPTPRDVLAAVMTDPEPSLLDGVSLLRLGSQVYDELAGLGPLTDLFQDPAVTDVVVNGPSQVWVDTGSGLRLEPGYGFADADELRGLAVRLAAAGGARLDESRPCADVRLPDGSRLHAVLPPIAVRGPYLSLRTLRRQSLDLDALVRLGTLTHDSMQIVDAILRARLAFVVSGGTGSGKTTLLAALLALVPATERIVVVEDTTELAPAHPHIVSLQARQSNVEGAGEVNLRDLVRNALRMRPDRLVVGECRGAEVVDLLGALNTGHEGGATTVHANAAADVPARFEALGLLAGVPRAALQAQLAAGLAVVLQLVRVGPVRSLHEVGLLVMDGGQVRAATAWHRDRGPGPVAHELARQLVDRCVPPPAALLAAMGWSTVQGGLP
jgi:pilus assembly protein CpaF